MINKTFGKTRKKTSALDLDITSLLDILVILLVFLLHSFNSSDLEVNFVEDLILPDSKSKDYGHHSVIVQVNKDKRIWVDNKEIGKINDLAMEIPELLTVLKEKKELAEKDLSPGDDKKNINKKINVLIDESLKFESVRQVMHTAAVAGFPEFKFIVKSNDE